MRGIWAVSLKLALVYSLLQVLCLLLVLIRAPSLGKAVTLPEGPHSLMGSDEHSLNTEQV